MTYLKKQTIKDILIQSIPYVILGMTIICFIMIHFGYAVTPAPTIEPLHLEGLSEGFEMIKQMLVLLITIVGALLILVGIVKLVLAHTNDDSSQQQRAVLMIGTGITLALLPNILNSANFDKLFKAE